MNFDQALLRVTRLLSDDLEVDFWGDYLSKGVIAGGSVVYALNDFVPEDTVGDVDIFFTDIRVAENFLYHCKSSYLHATLRVPFGSKMGPMVSFQPHDWKRPLQIILRGVYSEDVIETFDFDYVQCGLYEKEILISNRCKLAHQHRQVRWFRDLRFRDGRCQKALLKGFKIPVLSSPKTEESYPKMVYSFEFEYSHPELVDEYPFRPVQAPWYDLETLKITEIGEKFRGKVTSNEDKVLEIAFNTVSWKPVIDSVVGSLVKISSNMFGGKLINRSDESIGEGSNTFRITANAPEGYIEEVLPETALSVNLYNARFAVSMDYLDNRKL